MMRRMLATFGLLTMAMFLVAQADDSAKKKDDPSSIQDEVRLKEAALEARFQKLTVTMRTVAERLARSPKKEDRDKAELLQNALKLASEAGVGNKFRTLLEQLQKNKTPSINDVDDSIDQSTEVLKSLEAMLAILMSEGKDAERKKEIERLVNLLKELNKVIRDQKIVRAKTEKGAMDPKDLKDAQAKVTDNTRDVAKAVGGEPKDPKDAKAGEKGTSKDPKDAKDGKSGEGKPKDAKDGKDAKSGEGKPSDPKDAKSGEGKPKDSKPSEGSAKPKDPKDGKSGEGKPKDAKDGKSGEGKPSDPKDAKPGEGKPSDSKGKPSDSKPSQGQGKPSSGSSKPSDDKKQPPMPDAGPQKPKPTPLPGKKQIEEAIEKQHQAEEKLPDKKASDDQDEAIKKLEEARAELEKLLKQKREEEMDALLAQLEARCKYMLQLQIEVYEGTVATDKSIKATPDLKPTRADHHRSQQLSEKEGEIVKEAKRAIGLLEADNTAVAFTEVFRQLKEDMELVQNRLGKTDVGSFTQQTEQEIIQTLKDMIEALQKQRQEIKAGQAPPSQGQAPPPPKDLLDKIAELKLVKSRQIIVNKRTDSYGKLYPGEQAEAKDVQDELKKLGKDQSKLQKIIVDMATKKNE
jgi:hypothetical protein